MKQHNTLSQKIGYAKTYLRSCFFIVSFLLFGQAYLMGQKSSVGTGNWNQPDTWSPAVVPANGEAVTIHPNHTVTIVGSDIVNSGNLTVQGTLVVNSSNVTFGSGSTVTATGIYKHGLNGGTVGGTVPSNLSWANGSTLEVTGVTTATSITAAGPFHHVVWNCEGQTSTIVLNDNFRDIRGTLNFGNTGTGRVVFRNTFSEQTYEVKLDFLISSGARVSFRSSGTSGQSAILPTIIIGGSLINDNSALDALTSCNNCTGNTIRGKTSLVFTGHGNLKMGNITTEGNVGSNNASWDITFKNGSKIKCLGNLFLGGPSQNSDRSTKILIEGEGELDLESFSVLGTAVPDNNQRIFEIANGAFFAFGHESGISTDGLSGAIQLNGANTSRIYSPAATYVYNGVANQVTGNGLPDNATLRVDKGGDASLTIPANKPLKLDMIKGGKLILGNNTLTINNLVESGGDIDATAGTILFNNNAPLTIASGSWMVKDITLNNSAATTFGENFSLTLGGTISGNGPLAFAEGSSFILENGGTESDPAPVPPLPFNQLSLGGVGKHYNIPPGLQISKNFEVGPGATVNLTGGSSQNIVIGENLVLKGNLNGGASPISLGGDLVFEDGASYNPGTGGLVLNGLNGIGGPPQKIRKTSGSANLHLGKVSIASGGGDGDIEIDFGADGTVQGEIEMTELNFNADRRIKIKRNSLKVTGPMTGTGFGPKKFIALEGNSKEDCGKVKIKIPKSTGPALTYSLIPIGRLDGTNPIYSPVEIAVESPKNDFDPVIGAGFYQSFPSSACWVTSGGQGLIGRTDPALWAYLAATWDISPEIINSWEVNDKAYVRLLFVEEIGETLTNRVKEEFTGDGLFIAHCFSNPGAGPTFESLNATFEEGVLGFTFSTQAIEQFSEFTIGRDLTLNPVELLFLKAQAQEKEVQLLWATASEQQADYFEVQRSADGRNWQPMGKVSAQGNSSVRTDYQWVDRSPYKGWSYYRLWQQDWDGNGSFYGPISSKWGNASEAYEVYPTLVENDLMFVRSAHTSILDYRLCDAMGNTLLTGQFPSGNTHHSLALGNFPKGLYFLHIHNGNQITNHKIYKR
jgi:hypothetical protein